MFLVAVNDAEGRQYQINGGSIAYYTRDTTGKGSIITFSVVLNGELLTMKVADTPEQITTLINAKLRK